MRRGTGVPPVQSHGQDGHDTAGETPELSGIVPRVTAGS